MSTLTLNESMKTAVEIAQSLAKEYYNEYFYPAHLLRALLHKDVGLRSYLEVIGKDVGYFMEWAEVRMEECPKAAKTKETITGDEKVKLVFEEADNIRIKLGLDLVSPICVIAALSKPGVAFSSEQLKSLPLKEKEVLEENSNIR
ncbi:MAG: hypothetical protein EOO10_12385 [Chitinophagaceae bacterium]|nr:MAG: hypothetical protein EOO10_12385 [Chitinophagaceae bacterium]